MVVKDVEVVDDTAVVKDVGVVDDIVVVKDVGVDETVLVKDMEQWMIKVFIG